MAHMAFQIFKNGSVTSFFHKNKEKLLRANDTLSFISGILLLFFIAGDQSYQAHQRRFMISEIEMTALVMGLHTGYYKVDPDVLKAMSQVPRQDFIDPHYSRYAYQNVALPMIGVKHIVPEPFLTAMMIHLMGVHPHDRVLEIGYGTGYEAAILSRLVNKVYSLKQQNPLGNPIQSSGDALGHYRNIKTTTGNGLYGWKQPGPYDAILVKQAVLQPPLALIKQLRPYGRLVIPVEYPSGEQIIMVYLKHPNGRIERRKTLHVKTTKLLPGTDI